MGVMPTLAKVTLLTARDIEKDGGRIVGQIEGEERRRPRANRLGEGAVDAALRGQDRVARVDARGALRRGDTIIVAAECVAVSCAQMAREAAHPV